ncbi:MAG: four helix bundle protein [Cyclobacteriaceae bacterium]|nr:four helix bundle protein [Cyclobacteriaceae bacterium]
MEQIQSFRDLIIWQKSMKFAKEVILIAENNTSGRKLFRLMEQIQSSSASIPLNIAEGFGRRSTKEYIHFLYIARGSLNETLSLLELFKSLDWIKANHIENTVSLGTEISKMLISLIKKLSDTPKK